MIFLKEHVVNGKKSVAVCDANLLGKKFEQEDMQLDLTGSYYKGEETSEGKIIESLKDALSANFVGKESVGIAIKNSLIKKENVMTIAKVPYAQFFVVQ